MAKRLLLAEELVGMGFAARKAGGTDRDASCAAVEPETRAVHVVPIENVEVEIDALGIGARLVTKDLVRRQQLVVLGASAARRDDEPRHQHSCCETRRDHSAVSPSTRQPIPESKRDSRPHPPQWATR